MSAPPPQLALIGFGIWEILLLFGVIVLLFGAKKLPGLAKGLGSGIRNFKGELKNPGDSEPDDRDDG